MSRTSKIVLYSVLIAVLVIILIAGISMSNMFFRPFAYNPAASNSFTAIQAAPSEVKAVTGEFSSEDVIITAADTDKITVKGYSSRALDPSEYFTAEVDNGVLKIRSGNYRRSWFGFFDFGIRCEITVPKDMEFLEVNVNNSSGTLSARGINAESLTLAASSGEVNAKDCTGESAEFSAHSGMITTDNIGFNTIGAQANSGEIVVKGIFLESADLKTQSGLIAFDGSVKDLSAQAASGEVNVQISGAEEIDLQTNSGMISCEIEEADNLKEISARASSGEVVIRLPKDTPYNPQIDTFSGNSDTRGNISTDPGAVQIEISTGSGSVSVGY